MNEANIVHAEDISTVNIIPDEETETCYDEDVEESFSSDDIDALSSAECKGVSDWSCGSEGFGSNSSIASIDTSGNFGRKRVNRSSSDADGSRKRSRVDEDSLYIKSLKKRLEILEESNERRRKDNERYMMENHSLKMKNIELTSFVACSQPLNSQMALLQQRILDVNYQPNASNSITKYLGEMFRLDFAQELNQAHQVMIELKAKERHMQELYMMSKQHEESSALVDEESIRSKHSEDETK